MVEKESLNASPLREGVEERPDAAGDERIIIAVGAVIRDERGRTLLVRHHPGRKGFWQGKWICPGGELKFGEMIQEGIIREMREETHLEVKLTQSLPPFQRIARSEGEPFLHVIYIDYLAEIKEGKLRPDGDVGEALWFTQEEIYQRWEDLHDDTKRLLSMAGVI